MNTTAINLSGTIAEALSIPMEKAKKVERSVENTVDVRLEETVGRTVPPLVERAVATELKHLATKEDLKDLKVEMYKMGNRTILWMAAILIAMLGGFIATLFTLLQTRPTL